MIISRKSILTGEVRVKDVDITEEEYVEFLDGELLDIVAPDLCQADKQFILTGMLPEDEPTLD